MNWSPKSTNRAEEPAEMEALDPALKQALGDFKASVHGGAMQPTARPRTVREVVVRRSWQLAAGWSLAAVLLAGTMSGGFTNTISRWWPRSLQPNAQPNSSGKPAWRSARDEAQQKTRRCWPA